MLRRETVAEEIKTLDQDARAQLRKYGVRFGAFNIYFPILLKPAAAELILTLWSLKNAGANGLSVDALPDPPRAGLTSFAPDPGLPGGVLSRLRLSRVRPARGAPRHAGASRRSDPPAACLARQQRRDAAQRRDGRRRLHGRRRR